MKAAKPGFTSAANEAANLDRSRERNPSCGGRIGGAGAPGGGFLISVSTDSPLSGANAATYTSPTTLGSVPASLITAPPYECPTRMTGPSCSAIARCVAATSSWSEVSGFCTATACSPAASRNGITLAQLEPSAQAPCTRTTFFTGDFASVPAASRAPRRIKTVMCLSILEVTGSAGFRALAIDPGPDVRRTVPQRRALPFPCQQESDHLDAADGDAIEIDRGSRAAELQLVSDLREVFRLDEADQANGTPLAFELERHRP